jgi:hypothetical protein
VIAMTQYNVTAPEAGYDGTVGKVQFSDGSAVIDDAAHPGELAYCRGAGYRVEETGEPKAEQAATPDGKPAANANKDAWLRYAIQLGATPEQAELTKAQLIEWVNEREGDSK